MSNTKKTRTRLNHAQMETMINFLRNHRWLTIPGCYQTENKTRGEAQMKWKELTKILNSKGPNAKTPSQWRKAWLDAKTQLKTKVANYNLNPSEKIEFNSIQLLGIEFLNYKLKLPDSDNIASPESTKLITIDKCDFDKIIDKPSQPQTTDTFNRKEKEDIIVEEPIKDDECINDDIELPSHLDQIFNDQDNNEEDETESMSESCFGTDKTDYLDLNLDKKKISSSKYNNDLKEVCDLLIDNCKELLEVKQEKIFIDKAKATIEKRRIELNERKLKILLKEMKLKKQKLDIEFQILEENNTETK